MQLVIPDFVTEFISANSNADYLTAFGIFVGLFIVFKIFNSSVILILKKLGKKTKTKIDDFIIDFIDGLHSPFYTYLAFYFATLTLELPNAIKGILWGILFVFIVFYVAKGLSNSVIHLLDRYKEKRKNSQKSSNEIGRAHV